MLYLNKVVLGVTSAEGSSEEEVEPLRRPPSPEELVVLLRVHVELPLSIAPGILWEEEHPAKLVPRVVRSSFCLPYGWFTLCTPDLEGACVLVAPCPPLAARGQSCHETLGAQHRNT